MKKYFTSLNLIFAVEIVVVVLAALGFLPREAILFLTGLMIFYMIFSPVKDSLWLVVASIPLFVALPITDSFDSMANWRIIIAVLFLCLFFKQGVSLGLVKDEGGRWRIRENVKHFFVEYLLWAFLAVAAISILVASHKILGIKKLLFLINIFLLYLVIRNLLARGGGKEGLIKIWQAAATGGVVVVVVALLQFLAVLFVPLFTFWQFWTEKVISVFYGTNLSHLLSYSNTWFAYYAANPPTLRLFSVLPDSHSLAMFCVISVPIFLGLAAYSQSLKSLPAFPRNKRGAGLKGEGFFPPLGEGRRGFWWLMTGLAFFAVVLSGSRGAWLSAVPVILAALYFYFKKVEPPLVKKALGSLLLFVLLFVLSVGYPPLLYKFQSWQAGESSSSTFSFFERVRSISDAEEVSNKGRLEIWLASVKSVARRPLLGVGLGNYVAVLDEDVTAAKKGASAHNLYLDFATEVGIFGPLILLAMFFNILYTSWLVFRRATDSYFKLYGLLFGLYFLWIMGYSLFDVVLLNDKVFLLFMVATSTLYALRNIYEHEEKRA